MINIFHPVEQCTMSGFQRPSLRADTFQHFENHPKPTGSGLKAAFQLRTNNSPIYSGKLKNTRNCIKQVGGTNELLREFYDHVHKPNDALKSPTQDSLPDTENKENIFSQVSHSGLQAAFLARQRSSTMRDNVSEYSSESSIDNVNAYMSAIDEASFQEIRDDEDQENVDNDYISGYYSLHRLSHLNSRQGGSNLKKIFEARTGGTTRRTLGRNEHRDALVEKHANIIVSKMEQDETLMEDSPDAEELRRTALRDMPQCLTLKKSVKKKITKSVSQKSKKKPVSCWKMFKYRLHMSITKMKLDIRDLTYSFELWYEPLKKIEGNFGTSVASFFKFLRWLFLLNLFISIICTCFIVIPKVINGTTSNRILNWSSVLDLILGEGSLTNTIMYYGFYTNEVIGSNSSIPYSMPHAYFFTMFCIYIISFVVIGISAARSYRRSFIETEGGLKNVFANKIFCGWDYNIATQDAANLKIKSIYNEFKELISDFTRKRYKRTFYEKFLTVCIQFFMNVIILCLLATTAYVIWYFLSNVSTDRGTRIIVVPIFINSVMSLMPMFLSFVVRYEDYKNPKVALYLTLARTFLLGAVTVGALVTYWLRNNSNFECWENALAQEFYRMIIFDFFISVVFAAVLDVLLFLIYKYLEKNTNLEFDIAWNTMQIIYNQSLFWVGLIFSPILPIVIIIKLLFCWYIRLAIALFLCKPSTKSWRVAQASTWFLVMTFLSLLLVGGLIGYMISYIETSKECGPFSNYNYIYESITFGVLRLGTESTAWKIALYVTKPGVIAVVVVFLIARIYYSRAQANAQKVIVEQCRNMLVWSAKDKEYYYSLISQATKGQWQYRMHDRTLNPELFDTYLFRDCDGVKDISGATFAPTFSSLSDNIEANDQSGNHKKTT